MALSNPGAIKAIAQQIVIELAIPQEGVAKATANWTAIVTAIFDGIAQNAIVVPVALVAPAGGGPVTGTGMVQ